VLSQPLYTGGRTLAAYRYAKDLRDASRNEFSTTKRDTLLSAGAAYYDVLKALRLVVVSKDSLERMERHRKVTEREAATRRTKVNLSASLRANTLVSQARILLIAAEDRLRVARRKLATLTGFPADAALAEPAPIEPPSADMEALRQTAYANREEFATAKFNEAAAAENIALVRGGHLPQAYAEGGVQYKNSSPETLTDATVVYGGIRLAVPLFEGGLMKAETAEARSKLRQAELSGALLKKTIGDEVYESRVNLDTVTAVLEAAKSQYDDATKNFAAVESLFSEGLTTGLNLIDAQQALFIAEREYVNALYERQVAILRLQRSIGVLGKETL
jgi:outer membrane protein